MNFGQVTSGAFASSKTPYLSRFSATMTHPQHQPIFSVFHQNLITARFLALHFFAKKLKFYKPRKNCGFYNHSIGESQPMWITDSRVKPVESVWSLVGIETRGSIRCPNAVVIKLIRKDWKWFVKQNASFIFNQKRRYAIERCPCIAGASFYCLFNSFTRSIILKSCEQITVLPLISGRAKLLKIIL